VEQDSKTQQSVLVTIE